MTHPGAPEEDMAEIGTTSLPGTPPEPAAPALDAAELARVRAVESLGLRPEVGDERFDRITRLARRLFGVPMVGVSLIDENQQWFTSRQGHTVTSLPRERSMCDQTVRRSGDLVVEDIAADPRFDQHPVLTELGIRFYAGRTLHTSGERVGTLCLLDTRPHAFSTEQRAALAELAAALEQELDHDSELERAAEIQRNLLPRSAPSAPGWEFAASCRPARSVGGDFVDWQAQPDGRLVMTLADVMGKGLAAGLVAATVKTALHTASRRRPPAEALRLAAAALEDDLRLTESLVTLLHARLDPATGLLEWVDAGHGLQLVVRADGSVERSGSGDLPLGTLPGDRWTPHTTVLEPGDVLVACSDGLLDLFGGTFAALDEIIGLARTTGTAGAFVDAVVELSGHRTMTDDVTVVATRRLPR
ncbi:PP2C family protein-serine/threonine phosphatase [Pseudonocardia halophobica]|uniref:PP2C family protein-serine/threonine phosphatase n=1 Tax=Pseudonocardia halophobica TaxID=29401 RepID=UPI0018CC61F5|nr:SpoIIE family protein phosphatase [Pseudonocardia halophobica]